MPSKAGLAVLLLLLFGPASLALKLQGGCAQLDEGPALPTPVSALLVRSGLRPVGVLRPLNTPQYQIALYQRAQPAGCLAMLHVLPMSANGEAGTLLHQPAVGRLGGQLFVLRGQLSGDFPSARHWWFGLLNQLRRLAGLAVRDNRVYAIASSAPCLDPRSLDWASLRP